MALGSLEFIFLTISFLLPGYIINVILRTKRLRKSEESQIAFFRWLVLGTIGELIWLIAAFLVIAPHWGTDQGAWNYIISNRFLVAGLWFAAVFIWPFFVGWLLGEAEAIYLQGRRDGVFLKIAAFLGRMVLAQGPINDDSAWDTKFTGLDDERGQWILIELVDGEWIAGVFGCGSDASVDPHERDLYIADVRYTSFEDERFPGLGNAEGMLVPAHQIKLIHFWR